MQYACTHSLTKSVLFWDATDNINKINTSKKIIDRAKKTLQQL